MGSSAKSENTAPSLSPRSCSTTFFMSLNGRGSAIAWSLASLAWNSSRKSSGTIPTSITEKVWPSFMAAPFIEPSTVTRRSAVSMCERRSASARFSSSRVSLARAVRAACPAPTPAIRPAREMRPCGIGPL